MGTSTQFGSNAAKLSDYLNANKDQVQNFGQQVAGNLNQTYQNTMGAINQGFGSVDQQVGQGYTPYNPDTAARAAANPTEFVKNPTDVSSFRSMYNDQYTGPSSFESTPVYQDINSQVNKAVEGAGLTNNFSGLQSYLANNMGTANNTGGMQTLDTALLQRSPEARTAIQEAAAPFQNLSNYLGGKTGDLDTRIANAKNEAATASGNLQNQFMGNSGIVPTLQGQLTNQLTQTQNSTNSAVAKALQDWQSGNVTNDDMKALGLNPQDMSDTALGRSGTVANALNTDYGIKPDINSLFTQTPASSVYSTPGSAATPDQIAQMQALAQLTGQDFSGFLGSTSPNGQPVTANRQALGDLGLNLNQRDQDLIFQNQRVFNPSSDTPQDYAGLLQLINGGNPVGSTQPWNGMASPGGLTPDQLYNRAVQSGNPALIDAAKRMGWLPTTPPPTGGGGVVTSSDNIVHASSAPGVF